MQKKIISYKASDEFGPHYIVEVYDPGIGMRGFLVIDNLLRGPGKGGIRMTSSVTREEIIRLARTMTWKNALLDIPFGGAKAGIIWEGGKDELKKSYVQSFAKALSLFMPSKYIAGPDVNTGEREMGWLVEAVKNKKAATGKPKALGGLPHELGSTGFGVAHATRITAELMGIKIEDTRVAIEGFGNVGMFAFKFLKDFGARIVALSDSRGTAYLEDGFEERRLIELKRSGRSVADYPGARSLSHDQIFSLPVDILIPASVTDVINSKNKRSIKAKIIIEGANIPMQESVEAELWGRGIFVLPDIVANAGGVLSSYAEILGYGEGKMFAFVREKIEKIVREIIGTALRTKRNPREIALRIATERVERATDGRATR